MAADVDMARWSKRKFQIQIDKFASVNLSGEEIFSLSGKTTI
jgi:hypothetical protein